MFELSIDKPLSRTFIPAKENGSALSRLSEEVLNRDIDHLWKKMVTRHPVDQPNKAMLENVVKKVAAEVAYKDTDVYWSRICDEIKDPFYRMVVLSSIQKSELKMTPKDILQNYLNRVLSKQLAQQPLDRKSVHGKNATIIMDEFIGPADITALAKDPVDDVCDPLSYAKRTPNCIQVSTVFSRIFSLMGEPAVPVRYSGDLIPHVGISLIKQDKLLKYEIKDSPEGIKTIVQERSVPAVSRWQAKK